ncbi:NACHT domain-containing protein [Streptomyces xiaopingdaonensis]|uniref:NACHT domain-containing protein n=1 Tax=Streptomyces xiaopingdaonensis TaxID=1565415 RepID=UPI0002FBAE22|nr:NACHT domain-containing protein [Streptomyces xiaopingdaonensis]
MGEWTADLVPYGFGALLALVAAYFAKEYLSGLAQVAAGRTPGLLVRFLRRVLRRRPGGRGLRSYRARAVERYRQHRLGFVDGGSVDIRRLYVPLRYTDSADPNVRPDALHDRLRRQHRCVVLGEPGAGKSLLLKSTVLEWAETEDDAGGVPVLVNLHRCNEGPVELRTLLVDELRKGGVKTPEEFADRVLDEGGLRVFFDGLDEVAGEHRDRVARQLRDFAEEFSACPIVVTCRGAAWTGQLGEEFPTVLRIAEFEDASIRTFLYNWHNLGAANRLVGVDRVFNALRENPELILLARSPLMLTMIAYLQAEVRVDDVGPLPTSRAAFYRLAVDHLLTRDQRLHRGESLGRYRPQRKLMVLRRLALALQEPYASNRLILTRTRLDGVLTEALPDLNLTEADREPILDEIVQRSQLLLPVDRVGEHYAFAHLTLQEFLAAQELHDSPRRLLANFRADPEGWRETVKLWCAVASVECTDVVRELFESGDDEEQLLALECLGDATSVNARLAESIVAHFLADDGESTRWRSLGRLAAVRSHRGNRVLDALVQRLDAHPLPVRMRAAEALAHTGRPEAAEALAYGVRTPGDYCWAALVGMGEVAVPALESAVRRRAVWAVDALAAQAGEGGVDALHAMAAEVCAVRVAVYDELVWRCAWQLASLLRLPHVEEGLRRWTPPGEPSSDEAAFHWVWRPYGPEPGLVRTVGAVALLLSRPPGSWGGSTTTLHLRAARDVEEVDVRVALPVLGTEAGAWRNQAEGPRLAPLPERLAVDGVTAVPETHLLLLERLPTQVAALVVELFGQVEPDRLAADKWRSAHQEAPREPARLRRWATVVGVGGLGVPLGALGLLRGWHTLFGTETWGFGGLGPSWTGWVAAAVFVLSIWLAATEPENGSSAETSLGCLSVVFLCYLSVLGVSTAALLVSWRVTLLVCFVLGAACSLLGAAAAVRTRHLTNPYRRCLDAAGERDDAANSPGRAG